MDSLVQSLKQKVPSFQDVKDKFSTYFTTEENSKMRLKSETEGIFEEGMDVARDPAAGSMLISVPSKNGQAAKVHLYGDGDNRTSSDMKTLEDSLRYFELEDRLALLEESLEHVRRHRNNQEAIDFHNSTIQRLDKAILKLSRKIHPDKVLNRNGSEEELLLAQKQQTALNATRKALSILSKIFLEDLDIDHKYGFYTKLDISSLGNEDEIEGHVFDVLFKISLISEIKQRHIIAEIGKFLTESQSCIASYVQENVQDFDNHLSSAVFHLKQCIRGYNKLFKELKEVEEECRAEKMDNLDSFIRSMKYNSSEQLNHLEKLLTLADLCSKGSFGIFTCPGYLDDYFVCPFVSYMNIILMCDVFKKRDEKSNSKKIKLISDPDFKEQTSLSKPYYLTSYYGGSKRHEYQVQMILGQKFFDLNSVKEMFLAILLEINDELRKKFKVDEYSASGSKRHIAEELEKIKEMKFEFEQKKKDLAKDIALVRKDTQEMNRRIDKILEDQRKRQAQLVGNSEFQTRCEDLKANIEGINQQSEKMKAAIEQQLKGYEAHAAKYSELQARFAAAAENAEIGNRQPNTIMSEEHRKQVEACNANIVKNSEIIQLWKRQHPKLNEACAAKNPGLQDE